METRSDTTGLRHSVFWKVALILVGVQTATGLLAVGLSAWFAYDRSLDLVANSLRVQLDRLAEEVEQRSDGLRDGLGALPMPLRLDLSARFPDPVTLLTAEGRAIETIPPSTDVFGEAVRAAGAGGPLPPGLGALLERGDLVVRLGDPGASWGLAPVYDADGLLAGGLLVRPLQASVARELAGTREAFIRALLVVALLAVLIALLLGAFFTWRLLRPLRRLTRQAERIGAGDFAARVAVESHDELGRLAAATNSMAAAVAESIEALRVTDALRRELVANIGHDLRTPLAAMMGYVEESGRRLEQGQPEEAREALGTAERQGQYLRQLVDDLFELSVLDAAHAPLRREPVPLGELLHEAVQAHRAAYVAAGVALEADVPRALPIVSGDGVRLLRALDNLLSNARRHTPAGGRVTLRASVSAGGVQVQVRDTGEGMTPEVLAHIFDRYYRGDDARTRHEGGTGLGLAIALAIARAHGGDVRAESAAGEGSVFILELPLPGGAP